jgi:hypothetical protein
MLLAAAAHLLLNAISLRPYILSAFLNESHHLKTAETPIFVV